jgi:hypothetical protein
MARECEDAPAGKDRGLLYESDPRPGIAACPIGDSQTIHHPFDKAKNVKVRTRRIP